MRTETKLLRAAVRVLMLSRPADPRDCAYFAAVMRRVERFLGKIPARRRPKAKR